MSESSTAEREEFLAALIAKALGAYEHGEVGLARLVAGVERGIDALVEVAAGDWVEELRSAWSGLEIVYALALEGVVLSWATRSLATWARRSPSFARCSALGPLPDRLEVAARYSVLTRATRANLR